MPVATAYAILVDGTGAGVSIDPRINGDGAHAGQVSEQTHGGGELSQVRCRTGARARAERVVAEVSAGPGGAAQDREQNVGSRGLGIPRRDDDGGKIETHIGERLGHGARGDAISADVQPYGRGAVLEIVEDRRASDGGVGVVVELADVPRLVGIAQRPAAREGHRAGDAVGGRRPQVNQIKYC